MIRSDGNGQSVQRGQIEHIERRIAELVDQAGGTTYYVGGFVRDRLRGVPNKDVDIEVHGITPEALYEILGSAGEPLSFGQSFGVYSLRGYDIDIAMPRRERAITPAVKLESDPEHESYHENIKTNCALRRGHRDFEIEVDPFLGTKEAARRRDFTINAMMENVLTGEIIDHFGGLGDLGSGIIRHVDPVTFPEDPLRVLRGAQFAARFGFDIAPETIELCRSIDLSALSHERVEEELRKALLKADKPSIFFESLRAMDQLDVWFPELRQLIGLEQDPIYHPEGDVWIHTMEVIDRAAGVRDRTSDPYAFMLLALTHDLGKIVTTEMVKGRIHAYEHEVKGLPIVESLLGRICMEKSVRSYVMNMVPLHMRPNVAAYSRPSVKSTNRMFDAAAAPEDLIYFAMADRPVISGDDPFTGDSAFLFERLETYREMMARPYVQGRDLIEAGLEPGEYFGEVLEYAHKLRLAGIPKDEAMKQVLAYARRYTGK